MEENYLKSTIHTFLSPLPKVNRTEAQMFRMYIFHSVAYHIQGGSNLFPQAVLSWIKGNKAKETSFLLNDAVLSPGFQ